MPNTRFSRATGNRRKRWRASSAQDFQKLLPDGVATKDNYLYDIVDETLGLKVGMIWLARMLQGAEPIMFIYDFRIDEAQRRKGYGEQAMLTAEVQAKALGYDTIALHVFGFNHGARALYKKAGLRDHQHQYGEKVDGVSAVEPARSGC